MKYKNISLRKRILISNFMMVLVPIIFVFMILFIILMSFTLFTNSSSMLIRNILLNSSNYGPTLLIRSLNDELAKGLPLQEDAYTIIHKLEDLNVSFLIQSSDRILYTTNDQMISDFQQSFYQIAKTETYSSPYFIWNQNGMAYCDTITSIHNDQIEITFMGTDLRFPASSYTTWEHTKQIIKIGIVSAGITMISLIILLGSVLTHKLTKHIFRPIRDLTKATKEIGIGNLEYTLHTEATDEIHELCQNFEAMRLQLLENSTLKERYDNNRKELIAGISHDLNTPLTSIQGYVNGLMDGIADTPEKQIRYLSIIQEETKRMNELVESLFLFSKFDIGQEVFHNVTLDLCEYMNEWYYDHLSQWKTMNMNVQLQLLEPSIAVRVDAQHFHRVLNNIIQNSWKYRKNDHVNIDITVKIEHACCIIYLQDDGIGIASDEADKLFTSFYRSDPSRNKAKGNGLGLAIANQIITHSKGSIQAQGSPHQGLLIIIQLPIEEVSK